MKGKALFVIGALVAVVTTSLFSNVSAVADRTTGVGSTSSIGDSQTLPFGGYLDGDITIFPPFTPGSSADCNANYTGDPSAPGHSVTVIDVGQGVFNYIGAMTFESHTCTDPTSDSNPGTGVLIGANGERIFIEFDNDVQSDPDDPASVTATGLQWVTGGTGRFEGATGIQECHFTGTFTSPTTAVVHGTCIGTIEFHTTSDDEALSASAGLQSHQDGPLPNVQERMTWGNLKLMYR